MLRTYSNNITVAANNPIPFNTDKLKTGLGVIHDKPSDIDVHFPGYYEVNFNISYTGDGASTIQLFADNVAIKDAIISKTLTTGAVSNSSFNTIIKARPGAINEDVTLQVIPDVDITISNVSLGINKLF